MRLVSTVLLAALPLALVVLATWRLYTRRRRGGFGAAAAGAFYELLSTDRREAVQVIIEKHAERQDPEDRDGNLPDLEK